MDNRHENGEDNEWHPFEHQVAGHIYEENHGMLKSKNGTVLKPVQIPPKGEREVDFYEKIFKEIKNPSEDIITLKKLVPYYYGIVRIPEHKRPLIIERYLHLHDITGQFQIPCILDIKIGKRTWDHLASQAKITREKTKCPFQGVVGFKIAGMKVYNLKTSSYDFYDRRFCSKISSVEELHSILLKFFDGLQDQERKEKTLTNIIIKLKEIQQWFLIQKRFSFASSSVLVVYNADDLSRERKMSDSCHCEVKMIDFSHVHDANDYDTNYQQGIESTIHHLESCLKELKSLND